MSHTKEPWFAVFWSDDTGGQLYNRYNGPSHYVGDVRASEDLSRIVACVNACVGLPDPAENIKELVEKLGRATMSLCEINCPKGGEHPHTPMCIDRREVLAPFEKENKCLKKKQ